MHEPSTPSGSPRSRASRVLPFVLTGLLPAGLLGVGVARSILNHFFVRAPFLLDSGWYSALVYRAGLLPVNPEIACDWATYFYGVHFSPILSVFSVLSYLTPLQRIEWYALFQAIVYLPFGFAVHALSSSLPRVNAARSLPVTVLAALAFSFNGMVIVFTGSPHFEVAIPGLVCLLLAAVVTDRPRRAWFWLALTASVREDAGLHAALALAPLLYLKWRGVEMAPDRRRLVRMIAVAAGASLFAMAAQKLCFQPISLLRHVYTGDPAYGHIDAATLVERLRILLADRKFIYYPLLATVGLAALRRDPGYLLGWGAALPWFLVNFTAYDTQKSSFNGYTGFPFVVSMYWVYLYGARLAPAGRRLRPTVLDAVFALVCVSSTVGLYQAAPRMLAFNVKEMAFHRTKDPAAVHGFVDALGAHRAAFGRLYVDPSVAAVALEWLRFKDAWGPGVTPVDSLAFHRNTWLGAELAPALFEHQLERCTRIVGTGFMVCSRERLPPEVFRGVATQVVPAVFAFALRDRPDVRVEARGIVLRDRATVNGVLGLLPGRTYRLTLSLETGAGVGAGAELARLEIVSDQATLASATASSGARELSITFTTDGSQALEYHLRSSVPSELIVTGARLQGL